MIKDRLQAFWKDTSGAITVEWLVLGAAAIVITVVSATLMQTSTDELADDSTSYFNNINDNANY